MNFDNLQKVGLNRFEGVKIDKNVTQVFSTKKLGLGEICSNI
jgi:hypothetical protein